MYFARRATYRVRQFLQMLAARPLSTGAWEEVSDYLNSGEQALFRVQSNSAQRHAYGVMKTLRSAGHDNRDLIAAALLHDVGKARVRGSWWDKPLVVLAQAMFPKYAANWSRGEPIGWRRPFVVKERHAAWGAAQATHAGSSALTVTLIRRHQVPADNENSDGMVERLLGLLQWADEQN